MMKTFDKIVLVMKPELDSVSTRVSELIRTYGEKNGISTSYFVPRDRTEKILLVSSTIHSSTSKQFPFL